MATSREDFEVNQIERPWPSLEDVQEWLNTSGAHGVPSQPSDLSSYQWALDGAITQISRTTQLDVYKRSTEAVEDELTGLTSYPTLEPLQLNEVPHDVWLATTMHAARYISRRLTSSGMAGSAEFGSLVRTSAIDPDIMSLLGDNIVYGLA